jgi:hypothetical protein
MLGFLMHYRILQTQLVRLEQSKAELKAAQVSGEELTHVEHEITRVTVQMQALASKAGGLELEALTVNAPTTPMPTTPMPTTPMPTT